MPTLLNSILPARKWLDLLANCSNIHQPPYSQVKVTGNGGSKASGSQLVSIPGIYDNTKFPDIWSDGFKSFNIPGPAAFAGGSGNNNDEAPAASSKPTPPKPVGNAGSAPPPPSAPPASSSSHSSSPSPSATPSKAASAPVTAPSATGRCRNTKRSERRRLSKRHVGHAKRRHH